MLSDHYMKRLLIGLRGPSVSWARWTEVGRDVELRVIVRHRKGCGMGMGPMGRVGDAREGREERSILET